MFAVGEEIGKAWGLVKSGLQGARGLVRRGGLQKSGLREAMSE